MQVSLVVTPEFQDLGVRESLVLNAWSPPAHREEAERRGGVCTEDAARAVIGCRFRGSAVAAIEIDKDQPTRAMERYSTGGGCRLVFTSIAGRRIAVFAGFDCAVIDDWPRRAAEIEARLTPLYVADGPARPN